MLIIFDIESLSQLLEQVCYVPNETAYTDAKKPFNTPKNRYQDVVPCKFTCIYMQ